MVATRIPFCLRHFGCFFFFLDMGWEKFVLDSGVVIALPILAGPGHSRMTRTVLLVCLFVFACEFAPEKI